MSSGQRPRRLPSLAPQRVPMTVPEFISAYLALRDACSYDQYGMPVVDAEALDALRPVAAALLPGLTEDDIGSRWPEMESVADDLKFFTDHRDNDDGSCSVCDGEYARLDAPLEDTDPLIHPAAYLGSDR